MTFDTFEMFSEHMLSEHNEYHGEEDLLDKFNCILCDTNYNSDKDLKMHYSEKHIYCCQCNELLTDEDALQKHILRQHTSSSITIPPTSSLIDDIKSEIKEEQPVFPEGDSLFIKEESLQCSHCGKVISNETVHELERSCSCQS